MQNVSLIVDIILMKMALCEIINISTIPVKVSINEYIDISKDYSTPNSKASSTVSLTNW
jgi:N utilization substance protein B